MIKLAKCLSLLLLFSTLSCGQVINTRGLKASAGGDDQLPNSNLPQSSIDWDGQSMKGDKKLRIISID